MIRLTDERLTRWLRAYRQHRASARGRRIGFELTFSQWLNIWLESNHLLERGCKRGHFVMSRPGDRGPYAVGNVEIILHGENAAQAHRGKIVSAATRRKLSLAKIGKPKSAEHRRKLSLALKGRSLPPEQCAKIAASNAIAWQRRRLAKRIETRS